MYPHIKLYMFFFFSRLGRKEKWVEKSKSITGEG